jgi:transcriptional regulator with XRE-family HTH domain
LTFAKRLRELREAKGWTQAHLGTLCHLSTPTISMLENSNRYPGWIAMRRLSKAFDLTLSELLEGV